uniref:NADH-ubiquinone oxidoreductase chain 6 n=1 Tax=Gouania willdenowi TaxID=441366 RepID=A0A8C5H9P8_GOUWI
ACFGLVSRNLHLGRWGLVAVASNPSPYFAALGLVMVSGMGCGVLAGHGGSFLSLVLFLIYLGGMLVVFAYCAALAAEPYPESWGSGAVTGLMTSYVMGGWYEGSWVYSDEAGEGVSGVLLLTLLVVLELTRGLSRGSLRVV